MSALAKGRDMREPQTLLTGLAFGESPRWHDGRLWLSDWGAYEALAVDAAGTSEVVASLPSFPSCIDFLRDGHLLVVSANDGRLLRREADGSLETYADLSALADHLWNEVVVDGRDNAYVNNIGFDFPGGEPAPGTIALVAPDGSARQVADGLWYGDVPHRRAVRVREGGDVLQTIELDRGCFACAFGGIDGRTLFLIATEWQGTSTMADGARTGQVLTVQAPAPGAAWGELVHQH